MSTQGMSTSRENKSMDTSRLLHLFEAVVLDGKIHRGEYLSSYSTSSSLPKLLSSLCNNCSSTFNSNITCSRPGSGTILEGRDASLLRGS